jgi:shikimate dehydrogenase
VHVGTREIDLNFHGFSVTNPHKRAIIDRLDNIDETAEKIGAVNTVVIENNRLVGFNTDADGFIRPLIEHFGDLSGARVSVFGAGGAARACIYALVVASADVTVVARNEAAAIGLVDEFKIRHKFPGDLETKIIADIVVNATPLGTSGENENATIATAKQLADVKVVYDLTYNPAETLLIGEARAAGCITIGGMEMLIGQAIRQFELWTGETPSREIMKHAAWARLSR